MRTFKVIAQDGREIFHQGETYAQVKANLTTPDYEIVGEVFDVIMVTYQVGREQQRLPLKGSGVVLAPLPDGLDHYDLAAYVDWQRSQRELTILEMVKAARAAGSEEPY